MCEYLYHTYTRFTSCQQTQKIKIKIITKTTDCVCTEVLSFRYQLQRDWTDVITLRTNNEENENDDDEKNVNVLTLWLGPLCALCSSHTSKIWLNTKLHCVNCVAGGLVRAREYYFWDRATMFLFKVGCWHSVFVCSQDLIVWWVIHWSNEATNK